MFWLFPIWLGVFVVVVGCGLALTALLARVSGGTLGAPLGGFQLFWFGYALVIAFLEFYSLLFPIRWQAPLLLGIVAVAGFVAQRGAVRARLRSLRTRSARTALLVGVGALVTVWVAAYSARPISWYDTQLYHLQVVKWAREHAAVPGIANLHYRLAYNNSIHLFGALTDTLYNGRAANLTLGPLAIVTISHLLQRALDLAHARARSQAAYALLVLPFVLGRVASNEVASLSSDLPLNLLCIVVTLELIGALDRTRTSATAARRSDLSLCLALSLSAVATTTKLGGLGVLAVSGVTALVALRRNWARARLLGFALAPGVILFGYFARQAVLSGWLLFPAPIANLHLSWSLPQAETLDQFRWIQSWARVPGAEPTEVLDRGMWHWFEPWFDKRFSGSQESCVLGLALGIAVARLGRGRRSQASWQLPSVASAALSLLLWFQGAPDLRFGAGFFWMLLATLAAPTLAEALRERSGRLLGLSLCLSLAYWTGGLSAKLPHGKYRFKLRPVSVQATEERELSPGLKVRVPAGREGEDRCSNEPLPCTPYPARQRLRRDNDLGSGFLY